MVILETCPVCGHEVIEDLIFTYPMARYRHCEHCGWVEEDEPDYKDDEFYRHTDNLNNGSK